MELSRTFCNNVAFTTMELFGTFCCCNNGSVTKLQQWKKRKRKCTASLLRPPHCFAFTEIDPHDDDHDDHDAGVDDDYDDDDDDDADDDDDLG